MNTTFNAGLAYSEYRQKRAAYIVAAIVAFVMSSYFVVGYLAGDLLFWDWDISQIMNGGVGIGICFVMTAYQFILYSQGNIKGGKKATIVAVCVAVGFSLLSEVGQGMERDHVRMETKSQQSPTYQAIVGSITGSGGTTGHPYSSQLSTAQMKLARCKQKVSDGLWTDCIESTARLNSVQAMIQDYYQQNKEHAVTLANTAKTMEKDESNYHPLVSLIKGAVGSTGVVASFVLSLILISFFEYAFHYLGRQLAEARAELLRHGYDVTRKERKVPLSFGGGSDNTTPSPTNNTWNDTLSKSGLDSPDDDALNQGADPDQVQRIVNRAQGVPQQPQTVQGTLSEPSEGTLSHEQKRVIFDRLYAEIKPLVTAGDIKPTVRPMTDAVNSSVRANHKELGIKANQFNKPERQLIAQKILSTMEQDNIIERNTEGGVGKPKYILSGKYKVNVNGGEMAA